MWGGRDGAVAMGEGERCPQERPGPGPEAARMTSVAIGDVAAESLNVGVRGEPGLATGGSRRWRCLSLSGRSGGGHSRWRGLTGVLGQNVVGGERASCGVVNFGQQVHVE